MGWSGFCFVVVLPCNPGCRAIFLPQDPKSSTGIHTCITKRACMTFFLMSSEWICNHESSSVFLFRKLLKAYFIFHVILIHRNFVGLNQLIFFLGSSPVQVCNSSTAYQHLLKSLFCLDFKRFVKSGLTFWAPNLDCPYVEHPHFHSLLSYPSYCFNQDFNSSGNSFWYTDSISVPRNKLWEHSTNSPYELRLAT